MKFFRSTYLIHDWKQFTRFRICLGVCMLVMAVLVAASLTRGNTDSIPEVADFVSTTTPAVSELVSKPETLSEVSTTTIKTAESIQNETASSTNTTATTTDTTSSAETPEVLAQPIQAESQSIPRGILTPSGYKNISDIKVGDQVVGYNPETNSQVTNTVEKIEFKKPEHYDTWELSEEGIPTTKIERPFIYYTINQQYELFQDQSIFANGNVVHASELKVGDKVVFENGQEIIINDIFSDENHTDWLRFSVSGDHSYIQDGLVVHNASRYWVGGGSSVNWNATANTNWSATSGGANNASVPGASDDVIFDGVGGGASNSTLSTSITINSLDMTGYTNTLTHSSNTTLTIGGNLFKLSSGMTYVKSSSTTSTVSFTSTTGTSGSPTSIITNGIQLGSITITGSGGYFTSQDNLLALGNFTQSNGTYTASASTTINTIYTLSGGIFIAPSGTLTIPLTFTISGGTFNHNNGTINFNGGNIATISCNNATFNLVTFTHIASSKTVSSNCNLPLGNNPTITRDMTLLGTLSGTGTITWTTGGVTASSTNPFSGFDGASFIVLAQTAGTFTAPASTTISSTFTISGGTFTSNGTVTFSGGSAVLTCNNATFNLVVINNNNTKTVGSSCNLPLGNNPSIPNTIIVQGTLSGTGRLTHSNGFTSSSTNPLSGFSGFTAAAVTHTAGTFTAPASTTVVSLTLSGGTFVAPETMSVSSGFTLSGGTFDANGGTLTFTGTTSTLSCNNATFNLVNISHTSGTKTINSNCNFPLGNNPTISSGVILIGTLSGSGILSTSGTFQASSTNPISGFSALSSSSFTLLAGTFIAPASTTISNVFTVSAGTFIAPTNLSLFSMTINGGTFDHNNGTITFTGSTATLSCNNTTFNLIIFNNSATKTISENCTFPLGHNPTVSNSITVRGSLTGTGTLTSGGTLTASSTNPLSGFTNVSASSFSLTNGSFTAPPGNLYIANNFTISGGTFNHNTGTLIFNGTTATRDVTCNNATFNLVKFEDSGTLHRRINSGCTLPLGNNPSAEYIILNGGVLTGTGTLTIRDLFAFLSGDLSGFTQLVTDDFDIEGPGSLDVSSYTNVDVDGDFRVFSAGTFIAPATMTVSGNFLTGSGTFNHNNGSVILDGTDQSITGISPLYNLSKSSVLPSVLTFTSGSTTTIVNNITFTGSLDAPISLRSTTPGTPFLIDVQGTSNFSYLDVQDSTAVTPLSSLGVNSGNNTNWAITPVPVAVESSGGTGKSTSGGSGYIPGYGPNGLLAQNSSLGSSVAVCTNGALFNMQTGERCSVLHSSSTSSSIVTPYLFTRDLKMGDTHPEVKALQQYLNTQGFTIASSGLGSAGNETTFFGKLTQAALIKFQKSNSIAPAFGYFGTLTRAYISTH